MERQLLTFSYHYSIVIIILMRHAHMTCQRYKEHLHYIQCLYIHVYITRFIKACSYFIIKDVSNYMQAA